MRVRVQTRRKCTFLSRFLLRTEKNITHNIVRRRVLPLYPRTSNDQTHCTPYSAPLHRLEEEEEGAVLEHAKGGTLIIYASKMYLGM